MSRFEPMTYRFVEKLLNHCATLLGDNVGKQTVYTITLDFIISIKSTSLHGGDLYHFNHKK